MGTPDFAVPILKSLSFSQHEIVDVYTQPPKKKNRGQKISISPIHKLANELKLNVKNPENLNSKKEIEYIINKQADVVVVVAYGKIIPNELLNLDKTKFINIHASLLPRWRGAAPIHRAILNQDKETGISIMKIMPKLDTGPVMMKSKIYIHQDANYESLSSDMSILASQMILKALTLIEKKEDEYMPQNEKAATYAKKINKQEAKINWQDTARTTIAKINAFHPNPGAWIYFKGSRIKLVKAKEIKLSGTPGKILKSNFTVACKENAIQILELKGRQKKKC